MAALTITRYQRIANFYTLAQRQLVGVTTYYYEAAYEILLADEFDPEVDLLVPFIDAYKSSLVVYEQAPAAIVSAITNLQRHILDKARSNPAVDPDHTADRFTNINQWIDAGATNGYLSTAVGRNADTGGSFKVSTEFASLSSQSGFTIDSDNISS